jgi:hypothetical protein
MNSAGFRSKVRCDIQQMDGKLPDRNGTFTSPDADFHGGSSAAEAA